MFLINIFGDKLAIEESFYFKRIIFAIQWLWIMRKKVKEYMENLVRILKATKASAIIFFEIVGGIILSLFSLLVFIDIAKDVLEKEGAFIDNAISQFIYSFRNPILTDIMLAISFLGAAFILEVATILIIILAWKKHKREAVLFTSVLAMGMILNYLLKILIQRPRPDLAPLLNLEHSYSFPSGHAMNSFIFYSLVSYFVFHFTRKKRLSAIVSVLSLILIFLIGFSRIYLGVHYPSDVIAGFIVGFWVFVTTILIERTIVFFHLFRGTKESN